MIIGIIVAVLTIVIDQVSKNLIASSMNVGESKVFIDKILNITYIHNEGAAYGLFANARWIFMAISILIILAIPYFYIKYRKFGLFYQISLGLIFGGAVANMIDRIFLGYVVDFLEPVFLPFGKFINNFADIFVNVGAIMLAVYLIFINKTIFKSDKKDKSVESTTENNQINQENNIENDTKTE